MRQKLHNQEPPHTSRPRPRGPEKVLGARGGRRARPGRSRLSPICAAAAASPASAAMDSYYAMLSVTKESTTEELTKSYRKLSLKVHPDKRGGSEEAFQKLNRAYEVLKDEKSRAAYDRFGFDLGDDTSADDLAQEIGTHANRAVGVAAIRTAVAMVICCALRRRWLRAAAIGACGVSALAGRLRGDAKLEKIGFRVVVVPVVAWLLAALGWTFVFEAAIYCLGLGMLEYRSNRPRVAALVGGVLCRKWFGSRLWMFVKVLTMQIISLAVCHFFFVLVAALVKELVDQKLKAYGAKFRELVQQAKENPAAFPSGSPDKAEAPTRTR